MDDEDKPILEGLTIVTFAEQDDKTALALPTSAVAAVAYAAGHLVDMKMGWAQSLRPARGFRGRRLRI